MIVAAVVGVVWMAVASAIAAPTDRAAALATGYGAAQTVAAVLLTARVMQRTSAMSARSMSAVVLEAAVAGALSLVTMLWLVSLFDESRRDSVEAVLLAGAAGVVVFAGVMAWSRRGDLGDRRLRRAG